MYSNQAGVNAPVYEYNARYEPQATDDASWDSNSEKFPSRQKKANYRPTALRWYFIVGQIVFLMAVMGLVIWAKIEMPNSDGTAKIIHKRYPSDNPNFPQDPNENEPKTPGTGVIEQTKLATTVIVSDVSTVVTVPGTTGKYTTKISTTAYSTYWDQTTTVKDGQTITTADVTVVPTKVITEVVVTESGLQTHSVYTSVSVGYSIVAPSGSESGVFGSVSYTEAYTVTAPYELPGAVATYTSTMEKSRTETVYSTIVEDGETKTVSHLVTEAASTVYESVGETTASASTYVSYGKITITSVYTDRAEKPMANPKPTQKAKPTVIDVVTVEPDHTVKKVEKLDPTTYVTKVNDVETVKMVVSEGLETVVSEIDAVETTIDVVSTDVNGLVMTNKVISTKAASLATIVKTAGAKTVMSTKSTKKLKTITSDRTESSTFVSTVKGATRTYAKTTTIAPTATDASEAGDTGGTVKTVITVYELDAAKYFLGKFLPPILAVMLSIPARVIDYNAQLFQPFYAMNQVDGALGPESMNLHFDGWASVAEPFNVLTQGYPVPFITMLIVWCSALLTPVAVEAIGFKMHGQCKINAFEGCAPALGVSPQSSNILLAILGLSIILLCALLFFLRNFNTGLFANPWSVAGIASLASNKDVRPQQDSEHKIEMEMAEKRYGFGLFENRAGQTEYGIVLYDDEGENLHQYDRSMPESSSVDAQTATTGRRNPFFLLGFAWRLIFLLFLLGLMVVLLYYHLTLDKQSSFKNFMNSQTFGVRFLFATFGVIISFSWTAFFITIAMVVPYQVMSHGPQSASNSVLLTRSTNPFSGFWSAIKHGQIFPGIVALMAIFSEFMPILLANIPYSLSQVRISHDICARLSVGILALMALTIILSFVIRWPDMPVDPRSIAGAMYYVSESNMVDRFSGMASMDGYERKQRIKELGGTYLYGELTTRMGERRPAVEWDDHTLGVDSGVQQRKDNVHVRHENIDTGYYGHQP